MTLLPGSHASAANARAHPRARSTTASYVLIGTLFGFGAGRYWHAGGGASQQDDGSFPCRPCKETTSHVLCAEPAASAQPFPSELVPLANAQHGGAVDGVLPMCHAAWNGNTDVARKRPWMNPATRAFCTSLDGLYWAKPPVSGVREIAQLEHRWRMQCARTVKARSKGRSDLAQCRVTPVGSAWGGWHICEKALLDQDTRARALVYSFGLADDTSFGDHLVEKLKSEVHGFDPTRRSYRYMRRRARKRTLSPHYTFHNVGLSFFDGKTYFADTDDDATDGGRGDTYVFPVLSLSTLMEMNGHCWLDVLKIDIEGGEIAVLERMIMEGVIPTDQLLIEMHDWQGNGDHTERIDALVCGIKKLGFESVFARPPHEYTFIRIAKRGAPRVPQRNPRISARSNTNHWGGSKPKPLTPGEVLQRMTPQTVS